MTTDQRHLLVIGIGAGDPDHLTLAAVKAMSRADVFFVLGKGRRSPRRRSAPPHARRPRPRAVPRRRSGRPRRDRTERAAASTPPRSTTGAVGARTCTNASSGTSWLPAETGAFLVWGDPALYDSTLGILDEIEGRGTVAFDVEVIPGISSVSALAARHRITLNQVGRPVHITPAGGSRRWARQRRRRSWS